MVTWGQIGRSDIDLSRKKCRLSLNKKGVQRLHSPSWALLSMALNSLLTMQVDFYVMLGHFENLPSAQMNATNIFYELYR